MLIDFGCVKLLVFVLFYDCVLCIACCVGGLLVCCFLGFGDLCLALLFV